MRMTTLAAICPFAQRAPLRPPCRASAAAALAPTLIRIECRIGEWRSYFDSDTLSGAGARRVRGDARRLNPVPKNTLCIYFSAVLQLCSVVDYMVCVHVGCRRVSCVVCGGVRSLPRAAWRLAEGARGAGCGHPRSERLELEGPALGVGVAPSASAE